MCQTFSVPINTFILCQYTMITGIWKWRSKSLRNFSDSTTSDGTLRIICQVVFFPAQKVQYGPKLTGKTPNDEVLIQSGRLELCEDLGKALKLNDLSDVKIKCQDKTFNCHELILSLRSDVFRAMFSSNMTEKTSKEIIIDDFSSDAVSKMLTFIYTGGCDVNEEPNLAEELLRLADKYNLRTLKNICLDTLQFILDIDNCVKFLIIGDMCQAKSLKEMALQMVVENKERIISSNEWKELTENHLELALEVATLGWN